MIMATLKYSRLTVDVGGYQMAELSPADLAKTIDEANSTHGRGTQMSANETWRARFVKMCKSWPLVGIPCTDEEKGIFYDFNDSNCIAIITMAIGMLRKQREEELKNLLGGVPTGA